MDNIRKSNISNKQTQNNDNIQNNSNNLNDRSINMENIKPQNSVMSVNVQLILKQIFEFYCQFGERLNTIYLKSHKFFKFASEANLYDNNFTKIKMELIYKSEVGNNQLMDFKTFLNSLVKIADAKYNSARKMSSNESSKSLLQHNNYNRISSANKHNSSAAYAMNKSNSVNQSFAHSQNEENKKNKSFALGKLINEVIVPLHSNIFNNGNITGNPFEVNQNDQTNNQNNVSGIGLTRNCSTNLLNITRLDHKIIAESKFIENLLIYIIPNIYDIYKIYFPHEVSISEDEKFIKDTSYKKYLIFLKEFDLCPGLISKTISFQIFQNEVINPDADAEISENQEYYINLMKKIDINELTKYDPKNANIFGQFLNFFKFIRILVKISQIAYDNTNLTGFSSNKQSTQNLLEGESKNNINTNNKNNNPMNRNLSSQNIHNSNNNYNNLSLEDKLILTLERIELSEGFLNLEKKTMKTHSKRNATLIPQHMLNNLKMIYSDKLVNYDRSTLLNNEDKKQIYVNNIRLATNYIEICEYTEYIYENWGDELHSIFRGYCSYGDYQNTKFMSSNKFFKILHDCKLLDINLTSNYSVLNVNESSRILNVSRSVDNKLNMITPKRTDSNLVNKQQININKINNNLYINQNEGEMDNFGNIEGGDSQILGGLGGSSKIKLLKPNEIDSIFVKLCALSSSKNGERESLHNRNKDKENNFQGNLITGNTSTNDLFAVNNTSYVGMERSSSSNRFYVKKSKNSKIEFDLFIVGLEIISRHIFEKSDVKFGVDTLIIDYILKNISGKFTEKFNDNKIKIEYLKKKQDDPELLKILELMYETFEFAYKYYSDKKGLMNFRQLMKFASDFQIFPCIVSKSKLNSYFSGICEYLNESNPKESNINPVELIDQSLFVDIITLCALDLNFREPEPTDLEKILYFLEKIADSEGPEIILKNSGHTRLISGKSVNIIEPFKRAFPEYFKIPVQQKDEFYDILSGYYEAN